MDDIHIVLTTTGTNVELIKVSDQILNNFLILNSQSIYVRHIHEPHAQVDKFSIKVINLLHVKTIQI